MKNAGTGFRPPHHIQYTNALLPVNHLWVWICGISSRATEKVETEFSTTHTTISINNEADMIKILNNITSNCVIVIQVRKIWKPVRNKSLWMQFGNNVQ